MSSSQTTLHLPKKQEPEALGEEEEDEWVLVQFLGEGSLQGNNITTNVTNK
jgi:hypothetical protein